METKAMQMHGAPAEHKLQRGLIRSQAQYLSLLRCDQHINNGYGHRFALDVFLVGLEFRIGPTADGERQSVVRRPAANPRRARM